MARCPECGGGLGPVRLFRVRPGAETRCRWCRAGIAVSRVFSLVRDAAVVLAGSTTAIFFVLRWLDHGHLVDLLAAGTAPLLAVALGWAAELFAPLVTLEPRDLPHWARDSLPQPVAGQAREGTGEGRSTRSAVG